MKQMRDVQKQLEESTLALGKVLEWPNVMAADKVIVGPFVYQEEVDPNKLGPGTNRGIETMFRSAYRVQMELTALADNKANMLISINAIIMSIIIAAVAPNLGANLWLLLPTGIILLGTLASITYAIQAAKPRLHDHPVELADLKHSEGNILFFGNFAKIDQDDFLECMVDLISQKPLVYETMIRNIYDLGVVLNRKFALLQTAYSIFMMALILGVSSFICVFAWFIGLGP